ncbi:MAG: transglycosylase SLT domain-containing protein [Syntrophobacteraceae bacterium]
MGSPVQSVQAGAVSGQLEVPYIPPPTRINLCGEPVPLDKEPVYERFDKEFTIVVYNHAQVYLWLKRMQRYFPMIEERLRYYGLPDDLKYVAIAESDLLPTACSPKGAAGPWQFMASTGAAYGLKQCGSVDNRFSFSHATDSAFLLLKDLHGKYHSWALALAAYNAGDKRVLDAIRVDGTHNYYDLCLPLETERYVFRILAIKAVLSDPARYGYNLPTQYGYKPLAEDRVTVSLPAPVAIRTIADAAGTTYSEVKRLNPVFRSEQIPAGTYEIRLPQGTRTAFEKNFKPGDSGMLLAQRQTASEDVASRPLKVSRATQRRGKPLRLALASSREAGKKKRPEKAISHRAAKTAKSRALRAKKTKAAQHQMKRKSKPARPASPKSKGKGVHKKSKSHAAK